MLHTLPTEIYYLILSVTIKNKSAPTPDHVLRQLAAPILVQPTDVTRTQYTNAAFVGPPEDQQVQIHAEALNS
jgi:hypothetical protein